MRASTAGPPADSRASSAGLVHGGGESGAVDRAAGPPRAGRLGDGPPPLPHLLLHLHGVARVVPVEPDPDAVALQVGPAGGGLGHRAEVVGAAPGVGRARRGHQQQRRDHRPTAAISVS